MSALFDDTVLDAALDVIASATTLYICAGDPTTGTAAATDPLATVSLSGLDFVAPFNATPDGRGITVNPQPDVPVDNDGTPTTYCLVNGSTLLAKTDVNPSSPDLTTGSTTDIPAVTFSLADPAVV